MEIADTKITIFGDYDQRFDIPVSKSLTLWRSNGSLLRSLIPGDPLMIIRGDFSAKAPGVGLTVFNPQTQ